MECSKHREQCGLNSGSERPRDLVEPREVHMTGRLERGRWGSSPGWVLGLIPEVGALLSMQGWLGQVSSDRGPTVSGHPVRLRGHGC